MNRLFSILLGLSLLVFFAYVLIQTLLILLGKSAQTWAEMQQFYLVSAMIILIIWFSKRQSKMREKEENSGMEEEENKEDK